MSWEALHENQVVRSFLIKQLPEEDIRKRTFLCIRCGQPMSFVKEYLRENGVWRSHFAHRSDTRCTGYAPEGESLEHYEFKMRLLDLLHNDRIPIRVDNLSFSMAANGAEIEFTEAEKKAFDKRRPDILVKFRQPSFIFGCGLAIEVKCSESDGSAHDKLVEWTLKGYTVVVLDPKTDSLDRLLLQTYPERLAAVFEKIRNDTNSYVEFIKSQYSSFFSKAVRNGWSCLNCRHAAKSKKHPQFIICWKDYNSKTKAGRYYEKADFTPCPDRYEPRSRPPIVIEDEAKAQAGDALA